MIPNGDRGATLRLGPWCVNQRMKHRKNALSAEKFAQLDALNFEWEPIATEFVRSIAVLKKFKVENQMRDPPPKYIVPGPELGEEIKLGQWCHRQRVLNANGSLDADKVAQLDAVELEWNPEEAQWKRNILLLKQFQTEHEGRGCGRRYTVPRSHKGADVKLGDWCHKQRKDKKKNKLSAAQVAELNGINFEWDLENISWERAIHMYRTFKSQNSQHEPAASCMIYGGDDGEDVLFWVWARTQRKLHKKGKLSQEQIDLLTSLNFDWQAS